MERSIATIFEQMKREDLTSIIRETILEFFQELDQPNQSENGKEATHSINGDVVSIDNLPVPGQPSVDVSVQLNLENDDGSGFSADVPFGSGTIQHKYPIQHNVTGWRILGVFDSASGNPVQLTQSMKDEIDSYMEDYMDHFEDALRENPPEPYTPGER